MNHYKFGSLRDLLKEEKQKDKKNKLITKCINCGRPTQQPRHNLCKECWIEHQKKGRKL